MNKSITKLTDLGNYAIELPLQREVKFKITNIRFTLNEEKPEWSQIGVFYEIRTRINVYRITEEINIKAFACEASISDFISGLNLKVNSSLIDPMQWIGLTGNLVLDAKINDRKLNIFISKRNFDLNEDGAVNIKTSLHHARLRKIMPLRGGVSIDT